MPKRAADDDSDRRRLALAALLIGLLVVAGVASVLVVSGRDDGDSTASGPSRTIASPSGASASPPPASGTRPGGPTPTSTAPTAPAGVPRRAGITFGAALYDLSDARLARAMSDVRTLGMRWIRIDVSWGAVQPLSRDRYEWDDVDRVVSAAREEKLEVLALLTYTPSWARQAGCRGFTCPPRRSADFAEFAGRVVSRYESQGVRTYQVWNEPNITKFWTAPDPVGYGRLLRAAADAMREADDSVRVIFGGLAYVGAPGGGNIDAADFLRRACADDSCEVDAVGYDPYTYPNRPEATTRPLNAWQLIANPAAGRRQLRAALSAVGLNRTPVWVTAFGAPTGAAAASGRLVSEAEQARILVAGTRLAAASSATIGAYFVDTYRDLPALGVVSGHFGLLRDDGTRKPAFGALRAALRATR